MKILAIADEESKALWDYYREGMLEKYDLIISCGDLDPDYLSFLVTFAKCPVLYVRGNHDAKYDQRPPEGCICIDDKIYVHEGVRILGLGGSMLYNGGSGQYTERQMRGRLNKLFWPLLWHRGIDILVTHAPAFGLHDGKDLPHQGFKTFLDIIHKYKPKLFLHGHVHMNYSRDHVRHDQLDKTEIYNCYEKVEIEYL